MAGKTAPTVNGLPPVTPGIGDIYLDLSAQQAYQFAPTTEAPDHWRPVDWQTARWIGAE